MSRTYDYRPYDASTDRDRCAQIISHSFGTPPESCVRWLVSAGHLFRVLTDGPVVVGTVLLYDIGQFFGGKSVPMMGVAGVTVAPEARGRGVGGEIMRQCVLEMHELGAPISTLYPATQKLYQSVGFEQAGSRFCYRLPTDAILERDTTLNVSPFVDADMPSVRELYASFAAPLPGFVNRDDMMWQRVLMPHGDPAHAFVTTNAMGTIQGFTVLMQRSAHDHYRTLELSDVVYATPAAARRLLRFFRDHSSTVRHIVFHGGPHHPLVLLLEEQRYEVMRKDYWMTRILDVPKAIAARGYAKGLTAQVDIELTDTLIPSNARRWTIEINRGSGTATAGGRGSVKLDVRNLAPIYTGFVPPLSLKSLGLIEGDDELLRTLGDIFAGQSPAMVEQF